jgi:hypothetical protein
MDMITEGELEPQEAREGVPFSSKDEASLYDRQIRLWGLEAQNR